MSSPEFWIFPVAILGACVGSFLNVVIYRLPRGLSVTQPRWSFCPQCEHRIRAYDNIPIFGWLLLAGRCRDCRLTIPPMYPVVEALTALLFVAVWDAVFVARVVATTSTAATMVNAWPVAVALLFLFSSLMAMSVMDLETYTVDIRLCNATVGVGIVASAILGWINSPSKLLFTKQNDNLPPVIVAAAIAAAAGWFIVHLPLAWLKSRNPSGGEPSTPNNGEAPVGETIAEPTLATAPQSRTTDFVSVFLVALALGAMVVWIQRSPDWPAVAGLTAGALRGMVVLFVLMCALLAASMVHREADHEVVTEIEAQRSTARSMAWRELGSLSPAMLAAGAVFFAAHHYGKVGADWTLANLSQWAGAPWSDVLFLTAIAIAASVLAATLGWTVRILGTLAFGKEAFGTGDIYILAAMGAAGGLSLAVIGFFLAAFLALAGVAILWVRKQSRAVPFGPWLALGAFLALYMRPSLMATVSPALRFMWGRITGQPDVF